MDSGTIDCPYFSSSFSDSEWVIAKQYLEAYWGSGNFTQCSFNFSRAPLCVWIENNIPSILMHRMKSILAAGIDVQQ